MGKKLSASVIAEKVGKSYNMSEHDIKALSRQMRMLLKRAECDAHKWKFVSNASGTIYSQCIYCNTMKAEIHLCSGEKELIYWHRGDVVNHVKRRKK
jgi:hypothetical protein